MIETLFRKNPEVYMSTKFRELVYYANQFSSTLNDMNQHEDPALSIGINTSLVLFRELRKLLRRLSSVLDH
jgi:hypothetical protein